MKFIEPIGENLLLERIDEHEGTLVMGVSPHLRDQQGLRARVIASGPDAVDVKPDDVVLIGRAIGAEVNISGRSFLAVRARDLLGIIE